VEGSEGDGWATAVAAGSEEVVGAVGMSRLAQHGADGVIYQAKGITSISWRDVQANWGLRRANARRIPLPDRC
jgi:hypothetical protein